MHQVVRQHFKTFFQWESTLVGSFQVCLDGLMVNQFEVEQFHPGRHLALLIYDLHKVRKDNSSSSMQMYQ
jgi:hypothetical protein